MGTLEDRVVSEGKVVLKTKFAQYIQELLHQQSKYIDNINAERARLTEELARYKKEAEKIPQICTQPCYFDMSREGRDAEFMQKLIDDHCAQICPKWKEKWGA